MIDDNTKEEMLKNILKIPIINKKILKDRLRDAFDNMKYCIGKETFFSPLWYFKISLFLSCHSFLKVSEFEESVRKLTVGEEKTVEYTTFNTYYEQAHTDIFNEKITLFDFPQLRSKVFLQRTLDSNKEKNLYDEIVVITGREKDVFNTSFLYEYLNRCENELPLGDYFKNFLTFEMHKSLLEFYETINEKEITEVISYITETHKKIITLKESLNLKTTYFSTTSNVNLFTHSDKDNNISYALSYNSDEQKFNLFLNYKDFPQLKSSFSENSERLELFKKSSIDGKVSYRLLEIGFERLLKKYRTLEVNIFLIKNFLFRYCSVISTLLDNIKIIEDNIRENSSSTNIMIDELMKFIDKNSNENE